MGLERQGPKQETYAPGCKSTSPDGRLTDGERSQQGQDILDLDNDESRRSGCRPAHVSLAARPGSFYNRRVGRFIATVRLDDLRGGGFYVSETLFFSSSLSSFGSSFFGFVVERGFIVNISRRGFRV